MRIDIQVSIEDEITGSGVQVTETVQFATLDQVSAAATTAVGRVLAAAEDRAA